MYPLRLCFLTIFPVLVPVFLFTQSADPMQTIPLLDHWQFRWYDDTTWLPATVPGTVHTDLMANGVIPDPYFRTNEREVQWVDKMDWNYATTFQVDSALLARDRIELVFHGLDTYAEVFVNSERILMTDNFFCTWEAEVKPLLRPGENSLYIHFHSPINKGLAALEAHGYPLPASNDQSENGGLGNKKVSIFTRKPGYHYGWDWGPRLVTSGIWRPVELRAWDVVRISDLFFEQKELTDSLARLRARFELTATAPAGATIRVFNKEELLGELPVQLQEGTHAYYLPFSIQNPQRWWTYELGEPHLYDLRGEVLVEGNLLDKKSHALGLRTIRVVQEPDSAGASFYFELNGVPVFAKGANIIPNDLFLPRVDSARHAAVVQAAVDANMNMLRVWGGGIYEEDVFYDLCDRQGILVWQDFMFACSMYPGDTAFLHNVRREAVQNVRRLRNHPSIALWCGNNEIDVAWAQHKELAGWGWKQRYLPARRREIWDAYQAVFHDLLPVVVAEHAPGAFYWPSSPYHSPGEHATYNSTTGDIHYWGVWQSRTPHEAYYEHVGRFMSEYGFQSFPEMNTIRRFALPEDLDMESEVMRHHQRHSAGNQRIRQGIEDYYRLPDRFDQQVYLSHLLQAEATRMAIEAHRIAKPFCMGSLYWQHNDCWPVASWSGMDYYLNWKAMHYFVKKAFEPILVAAKPEEKGISVHVVSDRLEAFPARLELCLLDFRGRERWTEERTITVGANTAEQHRLLSEKELSAFAALDSVVLQIRLWAGDSLLSENLHYFRKANELALPPQPEITVAVEWVGSLFRIRLQAETLAKNVYLTAEDTPGFFSDNYFDLLPGEEKTLTFRPDRTGEDILQLALKLLSVADTY